MANRITHPSKMKKMLRIMYKKSEGIISKSGLDRFEVVQNLGRCVRSPLKSDNVEIDGHKMFLDSLDSLRLSINGVYEEFETEIVKKIIKKGDVVVDVGANIGYYTLIFAKLVGKEGKVFAFEPEPTNFNILKKNVKINEYENVTLINKAVSNKTGKMTLDLDEINKGGHSISKNNSEKTIEIESIRLDDYFKTYYGKINFIKLDIEGAEVEAIKGMSEILGKNEEANIMAEYNPQSLSNLGTNSEEYLTSLMKFGFKIYDLDAGRKKMVPIDSRIDLKKYKLKTWTNLLCLRENFEKFRLNFT